MGESSCIEIGVSRVGGGVEVSSARVGCSPSLSAERKGDVLSFRCGLVCTVASAYYLDVKPEVIWVLPESFSTDVVVYSNVTWHIE